MEKQRIEFSDFEKLVSQAKGKAVRNKFVEGETIYQLGYQFKLTKHRIIQILPADIMVYSRYHSGNEVYAIVESWDMAFESCTNGISLINLSDGYYFKDAVTLEKATLLFKQQKQLVKQWEKLQSFLYNDPRTELYEKYDVYSKYD